MTLAIQTSVNNRKSARQVDRSKVRPTIAATSLSARALVWWRWQPGSGDRPVGAFSTLPARVDTRVRISEKMSVSTLRPLDSIQMTLPVACGLNLSVRMARTAEWLSSALDRSDEQACSSYFTVRYHLHRAAERWQIARRGPQARGECDDNMIGLDRIVNHSALVIDSLVARASRAARGASDRSLPSPGTVRDSKISENTPDSASN
jgi:hypothetical protein